MCGEFSTHIEGQVHNGKEMQQVVQAKRKTDNHID